MHYRDYTLCRRSPKPNRISRTNARTADIDPAARILRSHSKELAIIKLIHDTDTHTHTRTHAHIRTIHIYIYTWAQMSKLRCHSVRITYTLVQKRIRSNDEVTKQKKNRGLL